MGPLRHFYGFCLSIDLLLWEMHQHGHRAKNSLNARESCEANPDMHRNEKRKDMKPPMLKQIDAQSGAKGRVAQAVRPRRLMKMYSGGALIGLFGGATAALFGSIMTGASWLVADDGTRQSLSMTGSVLLFVTIPLIVLGACCLDWMEKDEPGIGSKTARHRYEEDDDQ
jgi:hypothetical protein